MNGSVVKPILAAALVGAVLWVVGGCSYPVSDTGYLGTWEREVSDGKFSRIAIWQEGSQIFFCWSTHGSTKGNRVRCAPGGVSETVLRREVIYEHRFTVRPGDKPTELFVDVEGVPIDSGTTPIQWTDRLEVRPGGMELWSYKIRLNGKDLDPSQPYRFTKVADVPI